ncbi:AP2-like ethylene-responsive transcription factor ANT [Tanacetum coccineum]
MVSDLCTKLYSKRKSRSPIFLLEIINSLHHHHLPSIGEDDDITGMKNWIQETIILSTPCVTTASSHEQQILPATPANNVTDCVVMDTKKRGSEKVDQQKQIVHRNSLDTFGIDGLVDMKHICGTIVAKKKARLGREDKKLIELMTLAALRYWGPATHINFPLENYEQEVVEMKNMSRQEYVAHLRRRSSGFSRGASVYRGVTRHHQHGRWQARIGRVAGNKDLYLGTFIGSAASDRLVPLSALPHRRGVFWFYSYVNSIMGVKVLQLLWDDGLFNNFINRVILNCFDGEADEAQIVLTQWILHVAMAAGFEVDHVPTLLSFAECFGASRLMSMWEDNNSDQAPDASSSRS